VGTAVAGAAVVARADVAVDAFCCDANFMSARREPSLVAWDIDGVVLDDGDGGAGEGGDCGSGGAAAPPRTPPLDASAEATTTTVVVVAPAPGVVCSSGGFSHCVIPVSCATTRHEQCRE
jgi:hypothetical protein